MVRIFVLLMICLFSLLGACINVASPPDGKVNPSSSSPPVISFNVSPEEMGAGSTAKLDWNVHGANSITIDQGIGKVDASGSMTVTPKVDTMYTLTASNSAGKSTKPVTVTVKPVVMGSNLNKPSRETSPITANPWLGDKVLRPSTQRNAVKPPRIYNETLYDFVAQAPNAEWKEWHTPNYTFPRTFPYILAIGDYVCLQTWDNIVLEDGKTYSKSIYLRIPVSYSVTAGPKVPITKQYEAFFKKISIPPNSWFTAKVGFTGMANAPDATDQLIKFEVLYQTIGNTAYWESFGEMYLSYDKKVDQLDYDLSHFASTSGTVMLVVSNDPAKTSDYPVFLVDARIAR